MASSGKAPGRRSGFEGGPRLTDTGTGTPPVARARFRRLRHEEADTSVDITDEFLGNLRYSQEISMNRVRPGGGPAQARPPLAANCAPSRLRLALDSPYVGPDDRVDGPSQANASCSAGAAGAGRRGGARPRCAHAGLCLPAPVDLSAVDGSRAAGRRR